MSRIGKQPIQLNEGVKVNISEGLVVVTGPKGELSLNIPEKIEVVLNESEIVVSRTDELKQSKSNHGTIRSILSNMVEGVTNGFEKNLELIGLGYRAEMRGNKLVMHLGWTHPVEVEPPAGITFEVSDSTKVKISGIDKNLVGLYSAKIREFRKPEPYKGKGIKYSDEVVRRKTSKSVKSDE